MLLRIKINSRELHFVLFFGRLKSKKPQAMEAYKVVFSTVLGSLTWILKQTFTVLRKFRVVKGKLRLYQECRFYNDYIGTKSSLMTTTTSAVSDVITATVPAETTATRIHYEIS